VGYDGIACGTVRPMAWCQTCTIKPGGWNCAKSWHHLLLHAARGRTLWSDKSCPGTGLRTGMQENTPLSHTHSHNHSCYSQMARRPPSMQVPFPNFYSLYNNLLNKLHDLRYHSFPLHKRRGLSFILWGLLKCLTRATVKVIVNTTNYSLMVIICVPFNKAILSQK